MGDFSVQDTIGMLLGAYTAREQAKIDARMTASREQMAAYDQAWRLQQQQPEDAGLSKWLPLAGLLGLGLVVYLVAK